MAISYYTICIFFFYGILRTFPVGVEIWIKCGQSFSFQYGREEDKASFKNLQVLGIWFYNIWLSWGVALFLIHWRSIYCLGMKKIAQLLLNLIMMFKLKKIQNFPLGGFKSKPSPIINVTPLRVKSNSFIPYISVSAIWGVISGSPYLHFWKYKKSAKLLWSSDSLSWKHKK